MANLSVAPEEVQAKLKRLQAEMAELREAFADFMLTQDDLQAIERGRRDFKLGRTRGL